MAVVLVNFLHDDELALDSIDVMHRVTFSDHLCSMELGCHFEEGQRCATTQTCACRPALSRSNSFPPPLESQTTLPRTPRKFQRPTPPRTFQRPTDASLGLALHRKAAPC